MARHTFYIDYTYDESTKNYVEFFPKSFSPFKINRDKDLYFTRNGWGS